MKQTRFHQRQNSRNQNLFTPPLPKFSPYSQSHLTFARDRTISGKWTNQLLPTMKHTRKPVFTVLVLFLVACAIFYVASSDTSLGESVPISVQKGLEPVEAANPAPDSKQAVAEVEKETEPVVEDDSLAQDVGEFTETPFMPKMANETLKAKLGNSAWHLLHTVLARYPEKPTPQEKATLKQYIHFFGQVYPCGDCARHFQKLLKAFPPQTSSRKTAALWGCHIHNQVNKRLKKAEYDCTKILEDYDCGCGADEKEEDNTLGNTSLEHLREIKVDEKGGKQHGWGPEQGGLNDNLRSEMAVKCDWEMWLRSVIEKCDWGRNNKSVVGKV